MAKAKTNRASTEPALMVPKPAKRKKKKQLGFEDPPLENCQVCKIRANPPYVIIARHHIDNKKMGGRNNDPAFHSPENRIDVCEGPCANNCHKKADQRKPGYSKADLLKAKREDESRRELYETLVAHRKDR